MDTEVAEGGELLDFQREIFTEMMDQDGLLILGHGLGLQQTITAMVETCCDPNFLVILLNMTSDEETRMISDLALKRVAHLPKVVNNEVGIKERGEAYLQGGVISITSRILVTDILGSRFPIENVDSVIINHANKLKDTSMETFALNLFRERNNKGFVRAFSDKPEEFVSGFDKLAKTLRLLYIKKVHLRPRFHIAIRECLEKHPLDTVELCQPMTDNMIAIQKALLEVIENCLFELKRANPMIDVSEFTVANAIYKSFDSMVQQQFDPIWNQVSAKSKQLVQDLKTVRKVLFSLTSYDCVTFWMYLESFLTDHFSMGHHSSWLLLDAANNVFKYAKARVYNLKPASADAVGGEDSPKKRGLSREDIDPVLELNPKWEVLSDVIKEIEEEEASHANEDYSVLIVVDEERTCTQLRDYLSMGGPAMLERNLKRYFSWKQCLPRLTANIAQSRQNTGSPAERPPAAAAASPQYRDGRTPKRRRGGIIASGSSRQHQNESQALFNDQESQILTDFLSWFPVEDPKAKNILLSTVRNGTASSSSPYKPMESSTTSSSSTASSSSTTTTSRLSSLQKGKQKAGQDDHDDSSTVEPTNEGDEDVNRHHNNDDDSSDDGFDANAFNENFGLLQKPHILIYSAHHVLSQNALYDLRPKYIVLYDPSLEMLRHSEVYRAHYPGRAVRCYFTFYDESIEEQRYLRTIEKEVQAFEFLIKEKSMLTVREDQDGRSATFWEARRPEQRLTTTRNAGGLVVVPKKSKVVVDMREFRSSLPLLLHQRGIEICPITLEVGDYILAPEICVERKSVPDLISSLVSGRLYYQAESMCQHYQHAILLIEFEQNKAFALQATYDIKNDISPLAISSRLTLLSIHFPKLRVIWSTSSFQTAEIFENLKKNFNEPDADKAAAIGAESDAVNREYNIVPQDVLEQLPGLNGHNYRLLMRRVNCLKDLSSLTLQQLQDWIQIKPASDLHKFIHHDSRL